MLDFYNNSYWTRLMAIENYESNANRKFALGPDIVEECEEVDSMRPVDPDSWKPLFEPNEFNNAHGPLLKDNYKLSEAELVNWLQRCESLRDRFLQDSQIYRSDRVRPISPVQRPTSNKRQTHSMAK